MGIGGSDPPAEMPFGVEVSSPSEDQDIRLAPAMTAPNDKVPAVAHSPGFSRGMPAVRKDSGELLTLVLHLSPGLGGVTRGGHRLPRGDFGGGVLAVSHRQNIPSGN